jgi:IclR family pca regulon transcriptional regulator
MPQKIHTQTNDKADISDVRSNTEKEYVAGLEKGLSIIEAFGIKNRPITVSDAAEITGNTRASARRSLITLEKLGYVDWDGKYYRLAPRILRLGHAYITSSPLHRMVQPTLEKISERTSESSSFAVLDGTDVVFVARAAARRSLSNALGLGSRLPAYCAATGRVLLAALAPEEAELRLKRMVRLQLTPFTTTDVNDLMNLLEEVRTKGYALSKEEIEIGVNSIAVPIRDTKGNTIASMSIACSNKRRSSEEIVENILPELESARVTLSTYL